MPLISSKDQKRPNTFSTFSKASKSSTFIKSGGHVHIHSAVRHERMPSSAPANADFVAGNPGYLSICLLYILKMFDTIQYFSVYFQFLDLFNFFYMIYIYIILCTLYIYTYIYMYTYVHIYIYVYMYIYIYIIH